MSEEEIRSPYVSPVRIRVEEAARRLNLPTDASRAQLLSALASSRVIEPTLPPPVDDSHDLEEVFRLIPPQGLGAPSRAVARPTGPRLPSRQPHYTIRVHAVLCSDNDGKNAVTHTKPELVKLLDGLSALYYQAGLSFVLSNVTTLKDTMINQDLTIRTGWTTAPKANRCQRARRTRALTSTTRSGTNGPLPATVNWLSSSVTAPRSCATTRLRSGRFNRRRCRSPEGTASSSR
jgi:hypothetical protein